MRIITATRYDFELLIDKGKFIDELPILFIIAGLTNGISKFERDRRAILAMTGGYRTSFDFIETVGFSSSYIPAVPYQSWGTEYVYLIEDRGDFISLQHIIVMFIKMPDESISDAMVIKHWRQDWIYQGVDIL